MSRRKSHSKRFIAASAAAVAAGLGFAASAGATVLSAPSVVDSAPAFSAAFVATNTVDNTEAEYASAGSGLDTFLTYSFGSPTTFDKIVVVNRDSPGQSDLIGDFTLTPDSGPAVSVNRTPQRGESPIHSLGGPLTASTVRLDVDSIGTGDAFNNTGAMEVLFVQTPAGQTPVAATVVNAAQAFSPFFAANNAVDGVVGRSSQDDGDGPEYASATLGTATFVDFDLGAVVPVGGFDLFDRIAEEDRVTAFDLIFSQDSTFGNGDDVVRSYTSSTIATSDVFAAIDAQFVRFDVTAHNPVSANTGISEIVFYQVVPEPSSALALSALGLTLLARRRRR